MRSEWLTIPLDINYMMLEIENIVRKYISIKDLEYCFFSPNKRYPIDRKTLHLYNKDILKNEPYIPMYSAGLINDAIKFAIYDKSKLKKHYFKNVLIPDTIHTVSDSTEDYDESTNKIVVENREVTTYKISDKMYPSIGAIIEEHLNIGQKLMRAEIYLSKTKEYMKMEPNVPKEEVRKLKKKLKKEIDYLGFRFKDSLEIQKLEVSNNERYKDFDAIESILIKLVNVIRELNIPEDSVIKINDENIKHYIYVGNHILELRYKEAGML